MIKKIKRLELQLNEAQNEVQALTKRVDNSEEELIDAQTKVQVFEQLKRDGRLTYAQQDYEVSENVDGLS